MILTPEIIISQYNALNRLTNSIRYPWDLLEKKSEDFIFTYKTIELAYPADKLFTEKARGDGKRGDGKRGDGKRGDGKRGDGNMRGGTISVFFI